MNRETENFGTFKLLSAGVLALGLLTAPAHAADTPDVEALKAQLEEAQRLLAADKENHDKTAEKKRLIDERLAARKKKETEIFEELKALCEEQEKLTPGTLQDCLAKLSN